MKIDAKIQNLQSLNLGVIINDSARDKEKEILQLNQDQMYEKGVMDVNRPANKLHYAASTARQKRRKATYKRTDHITLRWFGDFYQAMKLVFFKDRFEIASNDLKWANWLEPQERFKSALGLTPESLQRVRAILRPGIIRKIKERI